MPRAPKVKSEEEGVVKRAPRRTVTKRASKTISARVGEDKSQDDHGAVSVRRKAPVRSVVTEETIRPPRQKREKSLYVSSALFSFGIIAAVLIGYSDAGQINPATVIAERNARLGAGVAAAEGGAPTQVIPVQNTSTEKNGGLIRSTEPQNQPPQETSGDSTATTTATSTEAVASSTEGVMNEESTAAEPEASADTAAVETSLEGAATSSVTAL